MEGSACGRVLRMQSLGNQVVHNHAAVGGEQHVVQRSAVMWDLRHVVALVDQIASLRHMTIVEDFVLQTAICILRWDVLIQGVSWEAYDGTMPSTTSYSDYWGTANRVLLC